MIGGTNSGGAGLRDTDAILKVQAPAGSIVTISKGGVSKSNAGHENADDNTVYDYYFIIHQNQFDSVNTWTVTATLSGNTASTTIIINASCGYDIELDYKLYIIKNGLFVNGFSFPNSLRSSGSISITEDKSGYGYLELKQADQYTGGKVTNGIDLTNYTILGYTALFSKGGESAAYGDIGVFNGYNKSSASTVTGAEVVGARLSSTRTSGTIDISSVSGTNYIGALHYTASNSYTKLTDIWELWLSK